MEPTLRPGDWVVALRRPFPVRRGQVITLWHPERPGFTLVKRVVGVPGDAVSARSGVLAVNGVVRHEPYAVGLLEDFDLEAGPGRIIVLSDNREASSVDSRRLGPIDEGAITSRVLFRYHPGRPQRVV